MDRDEFERLYPTARWEAWRHRGVAARVGLDEDDLESLARIATWRTMDRYEERNKRLVMRAARALVIDAIRAASNVDRRAMARGHSFEASGEELGEVVSWSQNVEARCSARLTLAALGFTGREAQVLSRRYVEGEEWGAIGAELGVTDGRACQIAKAAIERARLTHG